MLPLIPEIVLLPSVNSSPVLLTNTLSLNSSLLLPVNFSTTCEVRLLVRSLRGELKSNPLNFSEMLSLMSNGRFIFSVMPYISLYLVPNSVNNSLALAALVLSPIFCLTHCSASAWYWASRIALFSANLFLLFKYSGVPGVSGQPAPLFLVVSVHGYDPVTVYHVGPEHGLVCYESVHRCLGLPGERF